MANEETISVYARVRSNQEGNDEVNLVDGAPDKVRARNLEFNLNQAFSTDAKQVDVYEHVGAPLVQRVLDGYNACCLAYGQTGSGKTFTMLGPENVKLDGSGGEQEGLGIVPRACLALFKQIPKGFTVTTSYIEVYNDNCKDLLKEPPPAEKEYMALAETEPGHVEPLGITRAPVADTAAVMSLIAKGDARRVIAAMAMNPRSSRGHGLIVIEVKNASGQTHGRLTMVDLAGMESSKKSSAVEGPSNLPIRKEEAKRINMSLLALSSVVSALAGKGAMRVPFRDSKLTRLLQSSLAGNCKAAFIVMVRGEKKNVEEAINTLKFAQRASSVSATVLKNEDVSKEKQGAAVNKKLEEELKEAKGALATFHKKMAVEENVKDELMAQVQTLLVEMQQLQRDGEKAKKRASVSTNGAGLPLEEYVKQLEARNAALEEENRVLKQRDIMHRLDAAATASEAAPGAAKIEFSKENKTAFNPMAMQGFQQTIEEDAYHTRELRKSAAGKQQQLQRSKSGKSVWSKLRGTLAFPIFRRSSSVAPQAAAYWEEEEEDDDYWDDIYDDMFGDDDD